MKKTTALLVFLSFSLFVISQAPGVHWQRNLGNPSTENAFLTVKTNDNGIIFISNSGFAGSGGMNIAKLSANGVSQWKTTVAAPLGVETAVSYYYNSDGSVVILGKSNNEVYDYYVVKIDNNGNKVWENNYGGMERDVPSKIIKSINGGYILIGNSISPEITHDANFNTDAWLVKISETGILEWQKDLGGNGIEGTSKYNGRGNVVESSDGSIYVLSETTSTDGDVTDNHGGQDIWLVKLNSSGIVQWSKCLGGTGWDFSTDLKLSPAGDLYILGSCASSELTVNHAVQADFYFAIVSADGNLLFQKCFGSAGTDVPSQIASIDSDGSCVLTGTVTYAGYDVNFNHSAGGEDIWILKINRAIIYWQQSIGGFKNETIYKLDESVIENSITGGVIQTADGGYFISAQTDDDIGDIIGFHGARDIFTAKVSSSGTLDWVRAFGGRNNDLPKGLPIELFPNVFVVGGLTYSNDGDVQRNYGGGDPWILKTGPVNTIKGSLFLDLNANGIRDADEQPFSLAKVNINKGADNWTVVPLDGAFYLSTDSGAFVTSVALDLPYYDVVPSQYTSSFSTYFNTDSFSFALQPHPGINDLSIFAIPYSVARPGFPVTYSLNYKNAGTVAAAGSKVIFKKDPRFIIQSAQPVPTLTIGDTLKWDFGTLEPQQHGVIILNMSIASPPAANVGDTLSSLAIIGPALGDVTPMDDTFRISQRIQGAVDPNDKAENLGGSIAKEQVVAGDYITYFIRFQNTGTDTAFNVVVRDTLDNKLDWNTFQMIASSHPYTLQIDDQNKLIWTFYGINLPDSNVDEPGSHGYIAYRIKADNTLNIGATFLNRASIYFDFNLPINTNFALMIVGMPIALPLKLLDFDARYQQPDAQLKWTTAEEFNVDRFIIERGEDPFDYVPVGTVAAKGGNAGGKTQYQFQDKLTNVNGDKFYYRLRMIDQDNKFTYSNIALVKRNGNVINEVAVNPNPVRGSIGQAWINFEKATTVKLSVVDMQGRIIYNSQQRISKGYNVIPIDFSILKSGSYFLQVKTEGKQMVTPFVVIQ